MINLVFFLQSSKIKRSKIKKLIFLVLDRIALIKKVKNLSNQFINNCFILNYLFLAFFFLYI